MTDRTTGRRKLPRLFVTLGGIGAHVLLCAASAGAYRQEVRQAFAHHVQTVELTPKPQVQSTEGWVQNPAFETAEREINAAEILRRSGIAEDLRKAFKKYEAARTLWEGTGDKGHLASTLLEMGQVLSALHDDARAEALLSEARKFALEIGDSNVAAESQMTSGMLLLRHGDLQGALRQVEVAHGISISNNNRALQAAAASSLAEIHYHFGDLEMASKRALESLEICRESGSPSGMSRSLYWLGCISMAKRDNDHALSLLEESLAIARKADDLPRMVDTLTQIGGLYSMIGEKQRALETFVDLEPRAEALQDSERLARVYNGLDSVNQELGNIELSLRYCLKTIEMYHTANYAIGEAQIYVRLGGIQSRLGQYSNALSNYERSLKFFLQNGMARNTYYVLSDIGELYASQGNDSIAAEYYARAQQLIKAAEDPREYSYLLNRVGRISERTKGADAALECYREALKLNQSNNDRFGESQTLRLIAGAEKKLNHVNAADTAIKAAIDIDERLRDEVAVSDLRASYFAEVNDHFDFYIDLLMHQSGDDESSRLKALEISERKRARTLLDEVARQSHVASATSDAAAGLVERERKIKTQIEAKRDEYARLKQDRQSSTQADGIARELLGLTQEYDQLHSVIVSHGLWKSTNVLASPLTALEIQSVVDDSSTLLLEYSLGEERTFMWAISRDAIESYELPKRSVIEQEVLELNRAIKVMTRRPTLLSEPETRSLKAQAEEEFLRHSQVLTKILLAPAVQQLAKVTRVVIVADGALHYVPFSAMPQPEEAVGALPMSSDSSQDLKIRPLLTRYEITLLPSVSFLVAARRRPAGMTASSKAVAIIANPVFEKDDERLRSARSTAVARSRSPFEAPLSRGLSEDIDVHEADRDLSRRSTEATISQVLRDTDAEGGILPRLFSTQREALEIQSLAGPGASFVASDFDANRAVLTSGVLRGYRFIHIATHGFFDSSHPELSGIVLSLYDKKGQPQNGFVQIRDIYNLDLNADMVVLSACQTGLGKEVKGEGVTGLSRAFMAAGARRVVASLWKVDDDATAELMARFYRHLLKEKTTPSSALRTAQLEISAEPKWKAPFYWAGFFITGDFR